MSQESWAEYVARVTRDLSQTQVGLVSGISQSTIGRWKRGGIDAPRVEVVVSFARTLGRNPIEALIAAGYVTAEEANASVSVQNPLRDFTNDQLFEELRRRLPNGE